MAVAPFQLLWNLTLSHVSCLTVYDDDRVALNAMRFSSPKSAGASCMDLSHTDAGEGVTTHNIDLSDQVRSHSKPGSNLRLPVFFRPRIRVCLYLILITLDSVLAYTLSYPPLPPTLLTVHIKERKASLVTR